MNNLATTNKSDFTVTESGEAFISQMKASELLEIPRSTIQDWVKKEISGIPQVVKLVNENNQLSAELFQKIVISGTLKGYKKAAMLAAKLMEAGAKAFIYHEAGYVMKAEKPKTQLQLAREQVALLEHIEDLKLKHREEIIGKENKILDLRFELVDMKDSQLTERIEHGLMGLYNLPRT
jgi:hypothetical protein